MRTRAPPRSTAFLASPASRTLLLGRPRHQIELAANEPKKKKTLPGGFSIPYRQSRTPQKPPTITQATKTCLIGPAISSFLNYVSRYHPVFESEWNTQARLELLHSASTCNLEIIIETGRTHKLLSLQLMHLPSMQIWIADDV